MPNIYENKLEYIRSAEVWGMSSISFEMCCFAVHFIYRFAKVNEFVQGG